MFLCIGFDALTSYVGGNAKQVKDLFTGVSAVSWVPILNIVFVFAFILAIIAWCFQRIGEIKIK